MKYSQILPVLFLLLLTTCFTTVLAQNNVVIPQKQARIIETSLRRYESLKPIAVKLRIVKDSLLANNQQLHQVVVLQDSSIHQLRRVVTTKEILYQDQRVKTQLAETKAKRRGLHVVLVTLLWIGTIAISL